MKKIDIINSKIYNFYNLKKNYIYAGIAIFVLYLFSFLPLFSANYSYCDDLGRAFEGYHGFLSASRWNEELLVTLVHANWYLADISPIPQIMACAIMAACSVCLIHIFSPKESNERIPISEIIASSLIGICPYYLGMIVYKYDAPYMALSILFGIIPVLFYNKKDYIYVIISFLCTLLMATTYQASSGIFPLLVIFFELLSIVKGNRIRIRFLIESILSYISALLFFFFFLMMHNGAEASIMGGRFFYEILQKYINHYLLIWNEYTIIWKILLGFIVLTFVIGCLRFTKVNKIKTIFFMFASVIFGSFVCFGVYMVITEEAYDMRSLVGFNVFITILAIIGTKFIDSIISLMINCATAWVFIVYALTVGNAYAQQLYYEDYRTEMIVSDLNQNGILQKCDNNEKVKLYIDGGIGLAPSIQGLAKEYPMFERSIFTGLGEGYWGGYRIVNYYGLSDNVELAVDDLDYGSMELVVDNYFHSIYFKDSSCVIVIH